MADVVETRDLSAPGRDGWVVLHDVRRDDGELVFVRVVCRDANEAAIREEQDAELLEVLDDRGRACACAFAERVEAGHGATEVSLSLHPARNGGLIASFRYGVTNAAAETP
jgi:hypothetical protein